MIGKCKLCLTDNIELKDSHFLSAGIYRILRDELEKNPNPWLITQKGAVQTSRQMKAHLLCQDCEQRISRNGEDWVLRNCLRKDGAFPIASVLAARMPDLTSDATTTKVYYSAAIREINIPALAYFAASIFWRGSIHGWNQDGSIPVYLGPFQEAFRQHLMGTHSFPKDCVLLVTVREGKEISRLTYAPIGERRGRVHIYKFPMPGFGFSMTVSKNIPAKLRDHCFVYGRGNPIIMTDLIEKYLEADAVRLGQQGRSGLRRDESNRAIRHP